MNVLDIGRRRIGPGLPVMVIAEIGVNHDGSARRAMELVHHAKAAGADAVKLQVYQVDQLMNRSALFARYQADRCQDASAIDMLRRYELRQEDLCAIAAEARGLGLGVIATPFSPANIATLQRMNVDAIKIASPDLVNKPLLCEAARSGGPMLLSTGAATMQEIGRTVRWLSDARAAFALLHCVSSYPAPPGQAHLRWIEELRGSFDVPVGYSDHCPIESAGALAVACGASFLERHLTFDRAAVGPDHAASSDPSQFASYVRQVRAAEAMLGTGGKRVLEIEQDVRAVSRQSLVARDDLAEGRRITPADLIVQRPGTGISAAEVDRVVGRSLRINAPAGTILTWEMFDEAA